MIDLGAIVLARAAEQLQAVRLDGEEIDRWAMTGSPYCADCGATLYAGSVSPICPACRRRQRRARCWACGGRAEVHGYCRRHWEHIRYGGVVDPLHINDRREGCGAPRGGRFT